MFLTDSKRKEFFLRRFSFLQYFVRYEFELFVFFLFFRFVVVGGSGPFKVGLAAACKDT